MPYYTKYKSIVSNTFFPDTYVKVRMSFQNKALKTKRSCVAKKTNQPFFNESFVFKVPTSDLNAASVSLVLLQHASGHKG